MSKKMEVHAVCSLQASFLRIQAFWEPIRQLLLIQPLDKLVLTTIYVGVSEICDEMLELYGAKKEKPQKKSLGEKLEPSPNNSSSHSSPSVTNSPPFKRKVH